MTKLELITKVADRLKLPAAQAEMVVNTMFDSMSESMASGERLEIPGFGAFEVREDDEGDKGQDPTVDGG